MRTRVLLGLALAAVVPSFSRDCSGLAGFTMPGVALEITKTESVPAAAPNTVRIHPSFPAMIAVAMPPYCRVDGVIDRRTGVGGKPYGIGFALALPDDWSGRFLFQGGGGLNGAVNPPLGAVAAGDVPALARGFAIVSTDSGHKGAVFDPSFFQDQQAALDFFYVAIGRVAVVAKEMIARYYGKPAGFSYYAGCSTGGREGMIMSQRYPSLFNGIVAGAPAMRTGYSNLALEYIRAVYGEAAPPPATLLSDSERKLVVDSLLARCDPKDGIADGMIFDTRGCDFDPAQLVCKGEKTDACLSAAQAAALKKAFAGPKDARGNQVYPGFPFDAGIGERVGLPGLLHGVRIPIPRPDTGAQFDVDQAAARVRGDYNARMGDSTWTNLSTFSSRGGKLLFYHGMADPWFSAFDTTGYFENMTRDNGGRNAVESWSRLYLVPGMGHCQGGSAALDRFDMLTAITGWVEKSAPPDSVTATGRAFPGRGRPLCAYPKHAHYKGQGDPNDAGSFDCRE